MITRRVPQSGDEDELVRLSHENARLRKSLSLRGRLEEFVIDNARLRRALHTYGRHTHPDCHTLKPMEGADHAMMQYNCLCGLDEQLKENPNG